MDRSLTGRVIQFGDYLKQHGFQIFFSSILDSLEGLGETGISRRDDFFNVLRAHLVSRDIEWRLFNDLFEEFWADMPQALEQEKPDADPKPEKKVEEPFEEILVEKDHHDRKGEPKSSEKERLEGATYSPVALLERKNMAEFRTEDIRIAQLILKRMIAPFKVSLTRRFGRSHKPGDIDFRRTFRKSLKSDGLPMELFYRRRKRGLKKLVILADVSGSMERYARFVLPFILGLRGLASKVDVFVFSTVLTSITSILKRHSFERALDMIADRVPDWSGGTRIGYSLHQFNQNNGERLLKRRTVVVMMSDGWDLGGREPLRREMEILKRRAYSIIWLNPLAGEPGYQPLAGGMQTAMAYIDYFLPAKSLQSLQRVGRTLAKVMAR